MDGLETLPIEAPLARVSHHINRKPAANLFHAVNVAEKLGRPLNHMVTINFSLTACPADSVSRQFERLRDNYFGPWLRRCTKGNEISGPPTFIWVIENAAGWMNAHWLIHIPANRLQDFEKRLPIWLAKIAGEISPGAIHIRSARTPRGAVKYMAKGMDPLYGPLYRIECSDQGRVIGNRSNFSKCLRPSVRKQLQRDGVMRPTRRIGLPRGPREVFRRS